MELQEKLEKVADILVEYEAFPSRKKALSQLKNDYPKGYPTEKWIDGLLKAEASGELAVAEWDESTGNYNWMKYR